MYLPYKRQDTIQEAIHADFNQRMSKLELVASSSVSGEDILNVLQITQARVNQLVIYSNGYELWKPGEL